MSAVSKPSNRPESQGREPPEGPSGEPHVPLRLTVTRGRLGMELYEVIPVGPLTVPQASVSFMGLKFPLDLSGGVPAFRHRRGSLERVVLATDLDRLRKWIEPRIRPAVGKLVRPIDLWWQPYGLSIGLAQESSSLTWDVHWAPLLGAARLVVANARGWGLPSPPMAEALRLMDTVVGKWFVRRGRLLQLHDAGRVLGRYLFPAVGARAPAHADAIFGALEFTDQLAQIALDSTHTQVALGVETTRAVELSELSETGDDALARGDLDAARNAYLGALERAPRQRELSILTADIDWHLGRVESALGLLTEAMPLETAGAVGGKLMRDLGEPEAALELLSQAARDESYAPLAAMMLVARSELEPTELGKRMALDAAVAASPTLATARWLRFEARARFGDLQAAVADAQHLEAATVGRKPRHAVCRRVGEVLLEQGFEREAGQWFQRALRYGPDDVASLVGLARCLSVTGDSLRAIPLLERAVNLCDGGSTPPGDALIELSRLIATKLSDLPQAVARLHRVHASDPAAVRARAEEGRLRFMMGDVVGASLCFSRMRELVEVAREPFDATPWLLEAAKFEREVTRDVATSERHLAVALRRDPQNPKVQEAYREAAAILAVRQQRRRERGLEDVAMEAAGSAPKKD